MRASILRIARTCAGLSLYDAAAQAGVSFPQLSQMERGRQAISEDVIYRLASVYGVPVESLKGERDLVVPPRVATG
jgi:transcriptional regulator with XRE-family HTH domain